MEPVESGTVTETCRDCGAQYCDAWLLGGGRCYDCTGKVKQRELDAMSEGGRIRDNKPRRKRRPDKIKARRKAARKSKRKNRAA